MRIPSGGSHALSALVLDANARSALAAVRSLGGRGVPVFTADCSAESLAGCSRYSKGYFQLPSPLVSATGFRSAVQELADRLDVDTVFPMVDASVMLLCDAAPTSGRPVIAAASGAAYVKLSDKATLLDLAQELGIPAPRTIIARDADTLMAAAREIGFPCVLKPARSRVLVNGCITGTSVSVANRESDLDAIANSPWLGEESCLVQEFIPGTGAGLFSLCSRDGAVAWFAHRRIREKPPRGGVSTLSESIPIDSELRAHTERLLSAANWFGPAMVEFRIDPEGRPWLMEVNGRFWGSLQLAIDSGVDFPWLLYQLCLGREARGPEAYATGRRLRWLLGDFDHLLLQLRGKGTAESFGAKLTSIGRFLNFFDPNTQLEVFRRGDPAPFRYELRKWLRDLRPGQHAADPVPAAIDQR
jgi:predicted ATP-grasp superfamily ATP-dependent carboligase